jgi:hypothetical protein
VSVVKYVLIGLGTLVAVMLAAALIAPSFIDWNQFRARIAREASDALGRTVEVRGDIGLALLPTPILYVNDAHLANVEGASDTDMVSLASLEVRVALAPLLAGTVRVESVKLVRPVVNLEVMEGGRTNMVFARRVADSRTRGLQPKIPLTTGIKVETSDDGDIDVSVDNFVIEKGTLVYRNAVSGMVERVDNINGRASFASLKGPVDAVASAVVRGVPVSVDLDTAAVIQGRTFPFNLDLAVGPGNVKAQFSGSLNRLDEAPQLKGKLAIDGQNLKDFAAALGTALPDALRRPFGAVGTVSMDAGGGEALDLALRLDHAQGQGRLAVTLTPGATLDATMAFTRLDLDSLLRAPPQAAKREPGPVGKAIELDVPSKAQPRIAPVPADASGVGFSLEALPAELVANLNLAVEALTWRGEVVRQAKLNVSLANREITVNQLTALLPGSSDVALFGFVTEKDAVLQFDGTVDTTTNDLRRILEWLGMSTAGIAPERLRRLGFSAKLSARPDAASLTDLHARLDGTQIDGAATVEFAERLSVGANLTVDRINVDAYLPVPAVAAPAEDTAAPSAPGATTGIAVSTLANPLAVLAPLGAFDANLRARVAALTVKGLPLNDVRLEATLLNGVLDVKSLSVGDLVGVAGSLSGAVTGLKAPADPKFKDMVLDAKGKNLVPLFRMAEITSPVPPHALGPSALVARLNGSLRALDIALELQTMGGTASLTGNVQAGELIPRVEGRVALVHPDLVRFVRDLGIDYRPKGVKGGSDVAGKLSGSVIELELSELTGTVGGVRVQGGAGLGLLGRKPRLAVTLATSDLDIDAFLPQKRTAGLDGRPRIQPAAFVAPGTGTAANGLLRVAGAPWSSDPIDLSLLGVFDGTLTIKSESLKYGGITVSNADLDSEVKDGALAIRRFTGKSYGGDVTMDGTVAADPRGARIQARYALGGADVGAAVRAFGGKGAAKGSLTSEGQLAGSGRSMVEIVASLMGEGAIAARGIDIGEGAGSALGALGGLASSLDRIAAAAGGGRQKAGLLDVSGPYRITNGVVAFDELAFKSALGEGALTGKADLPKWQIAAVGEIRLAKNLLSELVVRDPASAKPIPFELEGALDAPRIKVDIAKLPGGGVRVPGLDKLRERIAPAPPARPVAPVTQEPTTPVSPQAQPPASSHAPPQAQPQAQPEPKKTDRAQDILRDILKGIAR